MKYTKKRYSPWREFFGLLACITALSACGGGGGGDGTTNPPPTSQTYPVSVTIHGYESGSNGLIIPNNNGDDIVVTDNGLYTFALEVMDGEPYAVTILTQPDSLSKVCEVVNGEGVINGLGISDIQVNCIHVTRKLSVFDLNTCAFIGVQGEEQAKCWGVNYSGKLGQGITELEHIGDGQDAMNFPRYEMGDNLMPIDLSDTFYPVQIVGGNLHSCALLSNHRIKCWGSNLHGQIGQGASREVIGDEPGEMGDALGYVDLGTRIINNGGNPQELPLLAAQISAGNNFTCALLQDGTVKCWGRNNSGQLGQPLTLDSALGDDDGEMGNNLPRVNLGSGRTAQQIAAGSNFVCAILDDSTVKCWGNNNYGQLGIGDKLPRGDDDNEMGDQLPVVNLGNTTMIVGGNVVQVPILATQISSGDSHVCAILLNGQVKCWGRNSWGVLGLNDEEDRGDGLAADNASPFDDMGNNLPAVDLGTGHTAIQIAAGYAHTCALLGDNTVKCWGYGYRGQLGQDHKFNVGDGRTENGDPTTEEMGDFLSPINLGTDRRAISIGAGDNHSCALLESLEVKCWGLNDTGQLGQNNSENYGDGIDENDEIAIEMGDNLPRIDVGSE